ncbi:hypothetical protein VNO77_24080 [Canavalia gladiata]|uniref:Uncharacterized protein n=1 Tax=Canavalia gladiata TaxID=3824 RepID=A0AAN9QFW4_CANGL
MDLAAWKQPEESIIITKNGTPYMYTIDLDPHFILATNSEMCLRAILMGIKTCIDLERWACYQMKYDFALMSRLLAGVLNASIASRLNCSNILPNM